MEITTQQRTLGNIGRYMMDCAVTEKDDALSNTLARLGNMLTTYGAPFGAKQKDFTAEDMQLIATYMKQMGA